MIAQNLDAAQICADQLTEGDRIRYSTADVWQVISEPEYVDNGIGFEVLCLDVETQLNMQQVTFSAGWKFESLDYQPLMSA